MLQVQRIKTTTIFHVGSWPACEKGVEIVVSIN